MAADVTGAYEDVAVSIKLRRSVEDVDEELMDFWRRRGGNLPGSDPFEFDQGEAAYLFDRASGGGAIHEPRTLGAWTFATAPDVPREHSYQRGYPNETKGERPTDRGHLIPFSGGGLLGPNVFIQDRALNRGWSADGKEYRRIEKAAVAAEAFFLCALIYADASAYPVAVELGVVLNHELHVTAFQNRFDAIGELAFADYMKAGVV